MLWTLIHKCTLNIISHKCTGDNKFGVRIVTNLGHQIWCPRDTNFLQCNTSYVLPRVYNELLLLPYRYAWDNKSVLLSYCSHAYNYNHIAVFKLI